MIKKAFFPLRKERFDCYREIDADLRKKMNPNANRIASVATAMFTEFVKSTVAPTRVVPKKAAPLPQMS